MGSLASDAKCCAFIDVLGYKALVEGKVIVPNAIEHVLNEIYTNLAVMLGGSVGGIRQALENHENPADNNYILARSFSDCFYLESYDVVAVLAACQQMFNDWVNRYEPISSTISYQPLMRCGIVWDWTLRYNDATSVLSNSNVGSPIGLGVARAYLTSEKSYLSGMRIIVSPEVISRVETKVHIKFPISHYRISHPQLAGSDFSADIVVIPVKQNERGDSVELFEVCWPVASSNIIETARRILCLDGQFDGGARRHFKQTAVLLLKALAISDLSQIPGHEVNQVMAALSAITAEEMPNEHGQ